MKARLIVFACVCLFCAGVVCAAEEPAGPIVLSLPELGWALEIAAPGFVMEDFEVAPSGEAARFQASNKKTGVILSAFLEKAPRKGNAEDCREYYWARARRSPMRKSDVAMSKSGDMAICEYIVKEYLGRKVDQKHLNAYLAVDGWWIDVHLSKTGYKADDQKLFTAILDGVTINKTYQPDCLMCCHFGRLFYQKQEYAKAAKYLDRAFQLDEANPAMSRAVWRGLVVRLGISYGMSGNVEKAKGVFEAAIAKDPEYPLFYYNLACGCAESNDREGAIKNLKLAYQHKANLSPDEELPNPKTDSSFRRFLDNKEFQKELEKMSGGK